jgi:hypothetical protein
MRVPTVDCRDATIAEQEQSNFAVTCIIAAGVCISLIVWALAIAKLVDLCNFQ